MSAFDPSNLDAFGRHVLTGEPFVEADVKNERQNQMVTSLPPEAPAREVATEWDDDGPVAWRTLTDDELAAAEKVYREALAKWNACGGREVIFGPESWTATAKTATGRVATFASLNGAEWRCLDAS